MQNGIRCQRVIDVDVNVKLQGILRSGAAAHCLQPDKAFPEFMATTPTYTISDLAREFDLTTRAIRFYEDMGLLQPQREGPGGRNRVYSARDRTRLKLTLRAKRLGLSLTEARDIIDTYDSPRDTGPQLRKFLTVLAGHRRQLEEQMADLVANLEEIKVHEKEARALLDKVEKGAKASSAG